MTHRNVNRLSQHFHRREFACKCGCGADTVDSALIHLLEEVRHHFDSPVRINSGMRCAEHNRRVGGDIDSQHLLGKAADIRVHGVSPDAVANHLEFVVPDSCGLGRYLEWTHIDVRETRARWGGG